jgi:peptidoglycan/LPS O-acetylase OafA/YrhL
MPGHPSSQPNRPQSGAVVAAGLLLAALALVVIYTDRLGFFSPLTLVIAAAIGVAALLLQLRLRSDLPVAISRKSSIRGSFALTILGVFFSIAAIFADRIHLTPRRVLVVALTAVTCFAISGVIVLAALRKPGA